MCDFPSSPARRIRQSVAAGGALRGGSGDSPSLLAPLFQEQWEFVMSKSSCWKGGEPPLSHADSVRMARAQRW